ncbi:TonB family protein [Crocinitomicaceae bacterium]|nr:TonB family protein [Crocinitomicaceae bacterium]MDB3906292.1 TonB family protein [Crocinitomicaceae bacterium]
MIEKKDSRANLEKNRVTIFGIGLLAAGSFTLAAFTYTSPMEVEEAKIASAQSEVRYEIQQEDAPEEKPEEILEEVAQDEPMFQTEALEELSEDIKTKQNEKQAQEATANSGNQKRLKGPSHRFTIREKLPDAVEYTDVEAKYVGGTTEMIKYVQTNVEYPEYARSIGEQGKIYVRFIVERDGTISSVKAVNEKMDRSLRREAERIVRSFPKWIPGELNGKRVRSYVRLPITFVLD